MSSSPGVLVLLGRFLVGRRVFGKHPSASTFFRRDDTADKVHWRHSGFRRAFARVGFLAGSVGLLYGYHTHPHRVVSVLLLAALVAAVLVLIGGGFGLWTWRHRRFQVQPLWAKLAVELKLPANPSAGFKYARDGSQIVLPLPRDAAPKQRKRADVLAIVEEHTRADYDAKWQLSPPRPRVTFTRRPVPPASVSWSRVLPLLPGLGPAQLLLGLDGRGEPATYDMDFEAPHLLLSIGTGGGKSTTLSSLICQLLRKTGEGLVERVVILDVKHRSLEMLSGIERVEIYREPAEMFDAMRSVQDVIQARKAGRAGSRLVVVIEEANLWTEAMQTWWAGVRADKDPKKCPALSTYSEVLLAGRAFRVNMIAVAQHASVAATGGGGGATGGTASRSQFGKVIFARFDGNVWKSFTGRPANSAPRVPESPVGQAYLYWRGGGDRICLVDVDPADARADALAHSGAATAPLPAYSEPEYNLREASDDFGAGVVPLSYAALRQRKAYAKRRDRPWPPGPYTQSQLVALTGQGEVLSGSDDLEESTG